MQKVKLRDVRVIMMAVNFIAVLFASVFIAVTTEWICSRCEARDFLDTLHALPVQPATIRSISQFRLLVPRSS